MGATNAPENVRNFWMIGSRWNWTDGETGRKKLHLAIQVYLGNIVGSVPGLHRVRESRHPSGIQVGSEATTIKQVL